MTMVMTMIIILCTIRRKRNTTVSTTGATHHNCHNVHLNGM